MLSLGRKAGTPSYLVVFPLWEGVEGEDLNSWVLLPSATLPGTDGPLGAGTSARVSCSPEPWKPAQSRLVSSA